MSTATASATASAADLPPPRERRSRARWTRFILPVFTIVMIVYLASPVLVMVLYGFNDLAGERQSSRFTCCTLDWWRQAAEIQPLNVALLNSVRVAFPSAIVAAALGTLIGLVLGRYTFSGRAVVNFIIFLAISIPEIVLGSALLSMFVEAQYKLDLTTILISHIGFSIAFVAITVRARVQGLDRSLENAAQDLFATPMVAFFRVTLPLILPGILAGFLLAFVLSLDDFVITNFVNGQTNTFPTWVFGTARLGIPPQVNVWGTVLFLAGITTAGLSLLSAFRGSRRAA